ncbi:MAG: hypothetical protein EOM77_03665 [Bacteroidia bacterium]|nr:hypothetical protein [Bacteroidia bacterium]
MNFDYSLKSLFYINPKMAMIDVLANMLAMTYNDGQFMGSFQRIYHSASYLGPTFGNMKLLQQGNALGYLSSIKTDIVSKAKSFFGNSHLGFSKESLLQNFKAISGVAQNMMNGALGNMLQGLVGGNSGVLLTKAAISGEPSGYWHLTIGNPLNPIIMMGNMIIDGTTMQLNDMLGYDDFPTQVKFDVGMKHGRPRDKTDIESMFNGGIGRIYFPIGTMSAEDIKFFCGGASVDAGVFDADNPNASYKEAPLSSPKLNRAINNAIH